MYDKLEMRFGSTTETYWEGKNFFSKNGFHKYHHQPPMMSSSIEILNHKFIDVLPNQSGPKMRIEYSWLWWSQNPTATECQFMPKMWI